MKISADKILTNQDSYDRRRFAEEIASNILSYLDHNSDSLVIGINGPWGSGKSTLLEGINESLKKSPYLNYEKRKRLWYTLWICREREKKDKTKLFILEFNPWIFSGKEQLHSNFLNELSLKIGGAASKLRKKIDSFSKRILWIGKLSSYTTNAVQEIEKFARISVMRLKREVDDLLEKNHIKAVIVMDDIDRLSPSEILEVFQLIKLNANFKNTVFLLAFDKQVVCESIKHQYNFDGERYLEKIVQVDYSIPSFLPEQIESEFFQRLTELLDRYSLKIDDTDLYVDWLHRGLRQYFRNIRDINRYFNGLNFRLPPILNDVNFRDFLLIEAIRLFDFTNFEKVRDHYKEAEMYGKKSFHGSILTEIPDGPTKMIYDILFQDSNNNQNADYRISNVEFFDRYFSLSVSGKDMREEEFKQFLSYPDNRRNLLEMVIKQGKLDFLLRRIIGLTDEERKTDLASGINVMFAPWSAHPEKFAEHWRNIWKAIITMVKTAPDRNIAMKKVIDEVSTSTSEFSPARFVFLWLLLEHINKEDDKGVDPMLEDFFDMLNSRKESLEKEWKHRLENSRKHFAFRDSPGQLYQNIFFPSYAKYCTKEYLEQATQLIGQGDEIFKIVNLLVFRDSSSGTPMGINQKYFSVLLPDAFKTLFVDQLKAFPVNSVTEQDSATIRGLTIFFETGSDPFVGVRRFRGD